MTYRIFPVGNEQENFLAWVVVDMTTNRVWNEIFATKQRAKRAIKGVMKC